MSLTDTHTTCTTNCFPLKVPPSLRSTVVTSARGAGAGVWTFRPPAIQAARCGGRSGCFYYPFSFKVTCKPGGAGFHVTKLYACIYQMEYVTIIK